MYEKVSIQSVNHHHQWQAYSQIAACLTDLFCSNADAEGTVPQCFPVKPPSPCITMPFVLILFSFHSILTCHCPMLIDISSLCIITLFLLCLSNSCVVSLGLVANMARGHQKFQSQQRNAKKQADIKKSKGHDQKAAAKPALVYTCTVCRVCSQV